MIERCVNCGGQAEHIHHAIPRSLCYEGVIEVRNMIPLCHRCHGGWHDRWLTIYRDVFTDVQWTWIAQHASEGWLDHWYPARDPEWGPF